MVRKSGASAYSPFSRLKRPEPKYRLTPILIITFIFLCLWDLAGPFGAWKYYKLNQYRAKVIQENIEKAKANQLLADEIERLKKDPAYQEKVVRRELGWIRKGEILYRFVSERR